MVISCPYLEHLTQMYSFQVVCGGVPFLTVSLSCLPLLAGGGPHALGVHLFSRAEEDAEQPKAGGLYHRGP